MKAEDFLNQNGSDVNPSAENFLASKPSAEDFLGLSVDKDAEKETDDGLKKRLQEYAKKKWEESGQIPEGEYKIPERPPGEISTITGKSVPAAEERVAGGKAAMAIIPYGFASAVRGLIPEAAEKAIMQPITKGLLGRDYISPVDEAMKVGKYLPEGAQKTIGTPAHLAGAYVPLVKSFEAANAIMKAVKLPIDLVLKTGPVVDRIAGHITRGGIAGAVYGGIESGTPEDMAKDAAFFGVLEGGLGAVGGIFKKLFSSNWYRNLEVKERGLVVQSIDDAIKQNPHLTGGQILRKWDNPVWRKEALDKYVMGKPKAEGPVVSGEPPVAGVPAAPTPSPKSFPGLSARRPLSPELATDLAGKPRPLPPGQGFEYTEPKPEIRLRKGPLTYPEGAEFVAGEPAPEGLEVEHKPIVKPSGEPYKTMGGAEIALKGSKRLKALGISTRTHKIVEAPSGGYQIVRLVDKGIAQKKEVKEKIKGKTLLSFVRAMGGIKDATLPGEVKALSGKETKVVGLTTSRTDKGLGFDEMAAAAVEHGWLAENLENESGAFSELLRNDIFAQKEGKQRVERLVDVEKRVEREERWDEFERSEDEELEYFAVHPEEEAKADLDQWERESIIEIRRLSDARATRKIEESVKSQVEAENADLAENKESLGFKEFSDIYDEKGFIDEVTLAELEVWRSGEEAPEPLSVIEKLKEVSKKVKAQTPGMLKEFDKVNDVTLGTLVDMAAEDPAKALEHAADATVSKAKLIEGLKNKGLKAMGEAKSKEERAEIKKNLEETLRGIEEGKAKEPALREPEAEYSIKKLKPPETEAIQNTQGAILDAKGLTLDVVRYQKIEQAGELSVRAGVFFLPEKNSPYKKHYTTGRTGYGGSERSEGKTTYRNPIMVKAASGGRAPKLAYDFINGKGAYEKMRSDVLGNAWSGNVFNRRPDEESIYKLLEKYGGIPDLAWTIAEVSTEGNTLSYAIQEHIVASSVRKAGYDAVIGYNKIGGKLRLSEVFDVRPARYPSRQAWEHYFEDFYDTKKAKPSTVVYEPTTKYRQSELDLAFGGKKKADEAIESVATEVDRVSRRRVPDRVAGEPAKSKIAEEMRKNKRVDLTGRKLTKENESQEIAELFQVYRSPKMEILHAIYTAEDGTVLGHNAMTSGSLGAVSPGDRAKYIYRMQFAAKRLGAAKVHILHNHPSGNPTMSQDDVAFAVNLHAKPTPKRNALGELMGEFIVIDHGKFTWVSHYFESGKTYVDEGSYKVTPGTGEWMAKKGSKLTGPEATAAFGQNLAFDKSKACFVYVDGANNVVGWSTHDKDILKKENLREIVKQQAKGYDASLTAILVHDIKDVKNVVLWAKPRLESWLLDVQDAKGYSLREAFPLSFERGGTAKPTKQAWGLFEPDAEYGRIVSTLKGATKEVRETWSDIKEMADEYLGAISTRLGNIHPSLKAHLRAFEHNTGMSKGRSIRKALPLIEKVQKMSKADKATFDLARKNGNAKTLQHLILKYNLGKEYNAVRTLLNNMHLQAKGVGYKLGYRKHFHPRVIKDQKGFLAYLRNQNDWSLMDKAIKAQEVKLSRYLEEDEKAKLISSLLRGYGKDQIKLSTPGQLKAREIDIIWPELNKFYMDSDAALLRYISVVTDAIESRKLFGVGMKNRGTLENNVQDTLGHYVLRLLEQGKIRPDQEHTLRDIYTARFNEVGTRGVIGLYKNLSYIDTMGSPVSAITQIGDLAWALYKAGIPKTAMAAGKAMVGKSALTKEDLGIERIAQEFADTSKASKAVIKVFRVIGLEKIDNIGKEALINATLKKVQNQAKNPKKVNGLRKELKPIFEGETEALIEDLQQEKISKNTKLYLFNVLSDFQPISLSEMTQKYLTGGNGRIFYMLKTFTLKQFDIYRREIFQQIAQPGTRLKGLKNLITLAACFVAANASADAIKALLLNRPLDLDDLTIDNLLRLFGISKFVTWKAREEGVGSAMVRQIAPPFKFMDALSKDIMRAGDEKGLETPASIPVGGKLYYWWFGKGVEKSERRRKRLEPKKRNRLSSGLSSGLSGGKLSSGLK